MSFFKKKTNIIFLIIIFILVAALIGVSLFAYNKQVKYKQTVASLSNNSSELEKAQAKIDECQAQIDEYSKKSSQDEATKAKLNAELQAAIKEKEKLQQENGELKSQIQELRVRKELQQQIALKNVNQADAATSGICYLTFDDGPSGNTLKILDILDAYGIKGTFFVSGTGNRSYMSQITARGHAIGLHTMTHNYSVVYKDINSYLTDIKQISDVVYKNTGVRSNIMRFPGGSSNNVSAKHCKGIMTDLVRRMPSLGYSYFDWNVDSGDASAKLVSAKAITRNVLNGARGKKSVCVLMHDLGSKTTTVEALPAIIEGLDKMGFRFAPLTAESFGFHQPIHN